MRRGEGGDGRGVRIKELAEGKGSGRDLRPSGGKLGYKWMEVSVTH
jgi:hypothetical protein